MSARPVRAWTLPLLLVPATTLFMLEVPFYRGWFDLYVYRGAVGAWILHGTSLYGYRLPGTGYGFTYPPFAALCLAPLALVPRWAAVTAMFLANTAASFLVLRLLLGRLSLRHLAVAACLFVMLEPVRDTFSFGQVNLLLLALVLLDERLGRWCGVLVGVAAAVKLTPLLFVGRLLAGGRHRAAALAATTAAATSALAWLLAPRASHRYWTRELWDTHRIGDLSYVSNQSLRGVVARLGDPGGGTPLWLALAAVTLALWLRGVRRSDDATGLALTSAAACLLSPVTWVHHLVWLLPALALLVRRGHRIAAGAVYVVLCSSLVWLWRFDSSGVPAFLGANAYAWLAVWLLVTLPPPGRIPYGAPGRLD
ncbi:glycosyltransferase 87 family protein [Streptacidiphilus monticola]|uniref:Glycosyltransferase 87 family protein n=1 Tax=Streptacidiphilus monticola TaxID=2161674 RepID=A0ABW1FVP0_9ACTN